MRSFLPLLAMLAACGSTISTTLINPAPHPMRARAPATVEVFTSGPPQGRHFVDIAFLEAEQDSGYSVDGTPEFIAELRDKAARMGCDGLVIGGVTNAGTTGTRTNENRKGIVATCIAYDDDAPVARAATTVPAPQ